MGCFSIQVGIESDLHVYLAGRSVLVDTCALETGILNNASEGPWPDSTCARSFAGFATSIKVCVMRPTGVDLPASLVMDIDTAGVCSRILAGLPSEVSQPDSVSLPLLLRQKRRLLV